MLCVLAPAALAMGIKPSCLDELAVHTQAWVECTHEFSQHDSRCKRTRHAMYEDRERCRAKGHEPAEIEAAMQKGYRKAGTRPPRAR